ncbi:MAG: DoxX family membrane protein [Candidatus Omnitrophica bacterium]|nr:DoxX family membrane protein [Candidatus Omnitrophota bacterium]
MFSTLRIIIGLLFVVSGAEKLIWPYQNFLYVLQSYQIIPSGLDVVIAKVFPWIEFITGLLLVLGLWISCVIRLALVMFAVFILIISQALLRKLPIDECGCFGQLISLKPQHTLLMDSAFFLFLIAAVRNLTKVEIFSLDKYFRKQ